MHVYTCLWLAFFKVLNRELTAFNGWWSGALCSFDWGGLGLRSIFAAMKLSKHRETSNKDRASFLTSSRVEMICKDSCMFRITVSLVSFSFQVLSIFTGRLKWSSLLKVQFTPGLLVVIDKRDILYSITAVKSSLLVLLCNVLSASWNLALSCLVQQRPPGHRRVTCQSGSGSRPKRFGLDVVVLSLNPKQSRLPPISALLALLKTFVDSFQSVRSMLKFSFANRW